VVRTPLTTLLLLARTAIAPATARSGRWNRMHIADTYIRECGKVAGIQNGSTDLQRNLPVVLDL